MQAAHENFSWWRKSNPAFRADILFRAAAIVRRRKHGFSAWIVKEGVKPWGQADADIAVGIDFMEYYARQMLALNDGSHVDSRQIENNRFGSIPLVIGLVS